MGLRVIRTWAFNKNSPASAGFGSDKLTYNDGEMRNLDNVISQASDGTKSGSIMAKGRGGQAQRGQGKG